MKRTITTFIMLICSVFAFAQQADDAAATNKWIEAYENFNTAKDWNSMLSQAEACKAEIPNWEFVYYYEGLANFNLKNYQQAVSAFDKFIEKNTATPPAYLYRANSYLEMKEADFAIRDYDTYLQTNPNDVAVMLNKAQARMIKKDYTNYINDLNAVLAIEPTNVGALATMNQSFAQAFSSSVDYMNIPYLERVAMKNNNKYALSLTGDTTGMGRFSPLYQAKDEELVSSVWVKPYAVFENVPLKNGPKVSNISYGTLVGFDSEMKSLKRVDHH